MAAFALSGKVYVAELRAGTARALPVPGPVIDPRPSPDGRHVAYVARGALRVVGADGTDDRAVAEPEGSTSPTGSRSSSRRRRWAATGASGGRRIRTGCWWPGWTTARSGVGGSPIPHPERKPAEVAYPAAGTPNAEVRLFVMDLAGGRTEVVWDRARYPYLARVHWSSAGAPLLLVQARDQRGQRYLAVDPATGATRTVHAEEDPAWLDLFGGVPAWTPDGRLVRIADEGGARVLHVGDRALTGARLHLQAVLDVGESDVLVLAVAGEEAAAPEIGECHVYRVNELGVERMSEGVGVHSAVRSGPLTVLLSTSLERSGATARVLRDGKQVAQVANHAQEPGLQPRLTLTEGARGASRAPYCCPPATRSRTVRFRC